MSIIPLASFITGPAYFTNNIYCYFSIFKPKNIAHTKSTDNAQYSLPSLLQKLQSEVIFYVQYSISVFQNKNYIFVSLYQYVTISSIQTVTLQYNIPYTLFIYSSQALLQKYGQQNLRLTVLSAWSVFYLKLHPQLILVQYTYTISFICAKTLKMYNT